TFGGFYEKHRLGKSTRHVFHIVGADDPVADVTYTELATPTKLGATTTAYPLTDALGTTLGVADEHGTVLENDYYDSWGRRTTPDGMPIAKPTLFQSLFGAGFTSHDHDDDLGLINMKGRLYDPVLGRFLSADPIVGNAAFSQSWNAYSYVNNSPINFIDPSGFDCTSATTVSDGGKTTSTLTGCHTSDNVTLPNGDEGTIADASRAPDAGALVSTAISFAADQKRWRHLELEIKSEPKLLNGAAKKSADGTPKNGADPWGWAPRKSSKGTGLAPSPRLSAEEAWRKQVIAEGGSFGPDGTFEGYSRGNVPMGTDDLVEAVIGSAGAPARFLMQTAHTVDTLADGKKSIWTKLRKIRGWFSAAESLMYDLSGNDNARAPSPIATRPPPDDDALYRAITIAQQFRQSPDVKIAIANYLNVRRQGSSQDIASAREKLYEALENARTRERERTRTTNDDDDPPPSTEPSPDYRRY
ncbi:MAG TPA: RHS repeat-associated core domain-containing protein, partial [Rhodanobacteraceae bacterium]|nr:RHS repeat-associated core domain-containing protein [Rhodanobacteraceae bacterium]